MTPTKALAAELRAEADPVLANDTGTPYARGIAVGKLYAADRLDALAREGWRPVESMPRDSGGVLVAEFYRGEMFRFGVGYWHPNNSSPSAHDSCGDYFKATHWAPLPTFLPPPPTGDA